MAIIEKHSEKRFGFRVRVVVKITQRDHAALKWFTDTFRVGRIRRNRTTFDWLVRDQEDVEKVLRVAAPYMKVKKRQASIAKAIIRKIRTISSRRDALAVARMADALSKFNVRSALRRTNTAAMIQAYTSPND